MADQIESRAQTAPTTTATKVSPRIILLMGVLLFLAAVGLLISRTFGQQLFAFLMCIGLGLIFVAVGDQGELQLQSPNGGKDGVPWLGGLAVPFARFVGGAAVSFLLLLILAFLTPWISLDSDRYARILVRANVPLDNYRVSVRTNTNAALIGAEQSSSDYSFVVFSSDITPPSEI